MGRKTWCETYEFLDCKGRVYRKTDERPVEDLQVGGSHRVLSTVSLSASPLPHRYTNLGPSLLPPQVCMCILRGPSTLSRPFTSLPRLVLRPRGVRRCMTVLYLLILLRDKIGPKISVVIPYKQLYSFVLDNINCKTRY